MSLLRHSKSIPAEAAPASLAWHALPTGEVAVLLRTDVEAGLTDAEADQRRAEYGPNRLRPPSPEPAWLRFLRQFNAPLIYILLASGLVAALLGEWVDAGVIFGVVLINAIVGYVQEGKAANALVALEAAVVTQSVVLRGRARSPRDAVDLVPGDVVLIAAGDRVPADLRLVRARDLAIDESALTGESVPVEKHTATVPPETPLAERTCMAYCGTAVTHGHAAGVVIATGETTEIGRISRLIATAPDLSTPLTRRLARFSGVLLWVIMGLAAATFGIGLARGEPWIDMLMAAVALAVGAIPEGLPAALTITLAIGVKRMARRRAVIRRLPAVEALGSTTVICTDKTGTLTLNRMAVGVVAAPGIEYKPGEGEPTARVRECLLAGLLCNDAALDANGGETGGVGDPTEIALLAAARASGMDDAALRSEWPRIDELPFDSRHQTMVTAHRRAGEGETVAIVKGAVERVLAHCALAPDARAGVEREAARLAEGGMRVLAFARATWADAHRLKRGGLGEGFEFLGLQGMIDPPRPEAIQAVRRCREAGIRVVMITGDHAATAAAIARQVGIGDADRARVVTGRELAEMDDERLARAASGVHVFARVEPEQKLRLVRALQDQGQIVAMTGDGVNDAPALRQADIGVAMGRGGTQVAREAAAMVLTDDNFATIEAAVEEGRGVFDNLVKFITWTLPTNFAEGLVILAAIVAGVTLPITPVQILWINMTTALLLGLMLSFEPVEAGIMRRPPRAPAQPLLTAELAFRIVLVSVLLLIGAFGLFVLELREGGSVERARTVAVNVFVAVESVYLLNCRSLRRPFWALGIGSNPWIWVGIAGMAALQAAITYVPILNRAFGTAPIGLEDWAAIAAISVAAALVVGAEKAWRRRKETPRDATSPASPGSSTSG